MFDDLRASPEVLWGALIAFGIVVLLTPAVGGMARLLGVVDRPEGRRLNKRPIPRLGGLAIFLGILVPALAFLDLSGESRGVLLCLLYTSPSPRDGLLSRMPSSA